MPDDARALRRRPRYFYVSRARFFGKHRGRLGLLAANLAWTTGRAISLLREALRTKQPHLCAREGLDIWANWTDPVTRSEPTD